MSNFRHKEKCTVSRQQAAERLTDIAYALTTGPPLELSIDGQQIRIPVPNELHLKDEVKAKGDRVELDLELSWSTAEPTAAAASDAAS
jgi:amphi-Trp domain-containing protein